MGWIHENEGSVYVTIFSDRGKIHPDIKVGKANNPIDRIKSFCSPMVPIVYFHFHVTNASWLETCVHIDLERYKSTTAPGREFYTMHPDDAVEVIKSKVDRFSKVPLFNIAPLSPQGEYLAHDVLLEETECPYPEYMALRGNEVVKQVYADLHSGNLSKAWRAGTFLQTYEILQDMSQAELARLSRHQLLAAIAPDVLEAFTRKVENW